MTDLVVLVLVLVWIAVLTPWGIRRLREGHAETSIDSFHQQLHLLERTGPKLVQPAYRLSTVDDRGELGQWSPAESGFSAGPGSPGAASGPASAFPLARDRRAATQGQRSRRRRRDVVAGLVAVAVLSGVLGSLHSLHLLWAVTFLSAVAVAAYFALVAYAQMVNADRDALRPVDQVAAASRAGIDPPWLLRMPRHASETSHVGVEVIESRSARSRAARSGLPGAWDDDELVSAAPRHAAAGG